MATTNQQTLLDVRTPEEFNSDHIEGAINIPVDQLNNRIDEVKALPTPIVAYCRSGNRSGMAVSILKQQGITDVTNGGGIDDMRKNGH